MRGAKEQPRGARRGSTRAPAGEGQRGAHRAAGRVGRHAVTEVCLPGGYFRERRRGYLVRGKGGPCLGAVTSSGPRCSRAAGRPASAGSTRPARTPLPRRPSRPGPSRSRSSAPSSQARGDPGSPRSPGFPEASSMSCGRSRSRRSRTAVPPSTCAREEPARRGSIAQKPRASVLAHVVLDELNAEQGCLRSPELAPARDPGHDAVLEVDPPEEVVGREEDEVAAEVAESFDVVVLGFVTYSWCPGKTSTS